MAERPSDIISCGALSGMPHTRVHPSIDDLQRHMVVIGGTGQGKSKFLEHLARQIIHSDAGLAFIDPHGDTAEELLEYIAANISTKMRRKQNHVHFIDPARKCFSFDPFSYVSNDDPHAGTALGYHTWLQNRVGAVTRMIARQLGESEDDQQKTVRFARWAGAALYAVGIDQGGGAHERFSSVMSLLQPSDPDHLAIIGRIAPVLQTHAYGRRVLQSFENLREERSARRREDWVESALNRFEAILSVLTETIFDSTAPPINFADIVRSGGVVIANLGTKQHGLDRKQSLTIAGLILLQILESVRTLAIAERRQFFLIVDEAHNFMGEDFDDFLTESRKYKVSFALCTQHPGKLVRGQLDLRQSVFSQCNFQITFQQRVHEHAEYLSKSFTRNKDLSPFMQQVQLQGDIKWHKAANHSDATAETNATSQTNTSTWSTSTAEVNGSSSSVTEGENQSYKRQVGSGFSMSESQNLYSSASVRQSLGESGNRSEGYNKGHTSSSGFSEQNSTSAQESKGGSNATGQSQSRQTSSSDGFSMVPIRDVVTQWINTGRPVWQESVYFAEVTQQIQNLQPQHCMVSVASVSAPFSMRVDDVQPAFPNSSPEFKEGMKNALLKHIYQTHACYFDPCLETADSKYEPKPTGNENPFGV